MDDNWNEGTEFKHYGRGHLDGGHSGRLPWGYGERPYQILEGTAEYDRLMKNKNKSSGSSREAYVRKAKHSNSANSNGNSNANRYQKSNMHSDRHDFTEAMVKRYGQTPYRKFEWNADKKKDDEHKSHEESDDRSDGKDTRDNRDGDKNNDAVKALEDKVKQLEQEKAALESKKTEKKGIKGLFAKKDKDEPKIEKKSRKELMNMSPRDLNDYITKLNSVNNALNLQSPTRKFLSQQGGELAKAISKDVAIPAMTRFVKQGLYDVIKSSNNKREQNKKLEDNVVKWLANYNPNPNDKTGQTKTQGDGGNNNKNKNKNKHGGKNRH